MSNGNGPDPEADGRLSKLGAWLAGGVTIVTGALTAVGIASGDIERVLRNQPRGAAIWLGMIGFGILAGAVVWKGGSAATTNNPLRGRSLAFAVLGTAAIGLAAVWPVLGDPRTGVVAQQPWRRGWLVVLMVVTLLVVLLWLASNWSRPNQVLRLEKWFLRGRLPLILTSGLLVAYTWLRFFSTGRSAMLLLGLWFGLIALVTFKQKIQIEVLTGLLVVGFLSFLIGVGGFFRLGIENTSAKDRPKVTAALQENDSGLLTVAGTVEASGLLVDEHIVVTVEGLNSATVLSDVFAGPGPRLREGIINDPSLIGTLDSVQLLHLSRIGADQSGNVSTELQLPIAGGLYERLRVSAFLASPNTEGTVGQLASTRTSIEEELARQTDEEKRLRESMPESDWRLATRLFEAVMARGDTGSKLRIIASHLGTDSDTDDKGEGVLTLLERALFGPPPTAAVVSLDPLPTIPATSTTLPANSNTTPTTSTTLSTNGADTTVVDQAILNSFQWVIEPWLRQTTNQSLSTLAADLRQAFTFVSGLALESTESSSSSSQLLEQAKDALKALCAHVGVDCEQRDSDEETSDEGSIQTLNKLRNGPTEGDSPYAGVSRYLDLLAVLVDALSTHATEMTQAAFSPVFSSASNSDSNLRNEAYAIHNFPAAFSNEATFIDVMREVNARAVLFDLLDQQEQLEGEFISQQQKAQACSEVVQKSGCVIVLIPEIQKRPTLQAGLTEEGGSKAVTITVGATEISASDYVQLTVLVGESAESTEQALVAVVGATRPGLLLEEFSVPLSTSTEYVCVWASLARSVLRREQLGNSDGDGVKPCAVTIPDRAQIELHLPPTTNTTPATTPND